MHLDLYPISYLKEHTHAFLAIYVNTNVNFHMLA